jgi:cyclic pyranopterin phosphate synthase
MRDSFGRTITYLRVSVTDRCNLRCVYCMPPDGIQWQPHDSILRYEEIAEVVRVAASQGVRRVRLTGGEPLVRHNLARLVEGIAAVPGIEDISLTTNAMLLESQADGLARAGLKRINVSLDTLRPERFEQFTRGGQIERVWRGIEAAEQAGLGPIKINAVAMKGINDDELADLARLSLEHPWVIRFIELMPVHNQADWGPDFPKPQDAYLPIAEVQARLNGLHLQPVNDSTGEGPAQEYQIPGAPGRVGFISPLSDHAFCQRCNRLRLTADGHLRACLMSSREIDLRPALRAGEDILPLYRQAIAAKPAGHDLQQSPPTDGRYMTQIGG